MRNWKTTSMLALAVVLAAAVSLLAQQTVYQLQYMVGERATILDQLEQHGYSYVRTSKEGDSSYTFWRENSSSRCVVARTDNGRVASIVYAPDFDCGQEQGSEPGWGSGNSSYGVTLYRDLNFSGTSQTFTEDSSDLRGSYIGSDTVTSVQVRCDR